MAPRNLVAGQYQMGDLIMGRGTPIRVTGFEVLPYDIAAQEFQLSHNDHKGFGKEQITPTTINMTFGVLRNYIRPNANTVLTDAIFEDFPGVMDLRREWRDPRVRRIWGGLKPFYVCGKTDGVTRIVWGRPGQFTYTRPEKQTEWLECLGEWRCADTISYRAEEMAVFLTPGNGFENEIEGTGGDAETWLRFLLAGPMVNPKIEIGSTEIELNYTLDPGEVVEISGYPNQRRIVNNENPPLNLSGTRAGNTPYLDKLYIDFDAVLPVNLVATGTNSSSAVAVCWHDAFELID